jgi:8-oxo-dGTP pyrophosphatase MutT (NUDIX family)
MTDQGEPVDRVAAVCYRQANDMVQFKLVRTQGGHWTFPKGHVEIGETPSMAAQREALEEAGVRGSIASEPFTVFLHEKRASDGRRMELTVAAYFLCVESESGTPEHGRDPTWFHPEEAKQKLAEKRSPRYQQAYFNVIDEARRRLGHRGTGNGLEER